MTIPLKISFGNGRELQRYLDAQDGTESELTQKIVKLVENTTFLKGTFVSDLSQKLLNNEEDYSTETIKIYADAIIKYYNEKNLDFTNCTVDDIDQWLRDHSKTKECTMFIEQISKICAGKSFDKANFVKILQDQLLKKEMSERAERIGDLWVCVVVNYSKALNDFSDDLNYRGSVMNLKDDAS